VAVEERIEYLEQNDICKPSLLNPPNGQGGQGQQQQLQEQQQDDGRRKHDPINDFSSAHQHNQRMRENNKNNPVQKQPHQSQVGQIKE